MLQNRFQPEMIGEDAGRVSGLPVGEAFQVFDKGVEVIVDRGILQVGADNVFALPPEFVQRVEFGRPFGEPEQLDPQIVGQLLRCLRGVARVFI